jgi:sugar phosphate isomerase/epimerase
MRLAIAISTHASQFEALAFKGELSSRLGEIADIGFDGVELAIRDPRLIEVDELRKLAAIHRVSVAAISTGQAFTEEGLSLVSSKREARELAVQRLMSHVPVAARLDAIIIVGLLGTATLDGQSVTEATARLAESLSVFAAAAGKEGVRVALEPINRYESAFIRTVGEALDLLEQVDQRNVGLLLDTFHMNIEEVSIADSIRRCSDRIFHVHVADSNRWHPGGGHLDFKSVLAGLEEVGYAGYLSGEFLPVPDGRTAAERFVAYMRPFQAV